MKKIINILNTIKNIISQKNEDLKIFDNSKMNPLMYIDKKINTIEWIYNGRKCIVKASEENFQDAVLSTIDRVVDKTNKKPILFYV